MGKILSKIGWNLFILMLMVVGQRKPIAENIYSFLNLKDEIVSIDNFMLIFFAFGVLAVYIYYPFKLENLRRKTTKKDEHLKEVLKEFRTVFSKTLGKEVKQHELKLNVRKFTPMPFYKKPIKYWFKTEKKYFVVKNYDFLSDNTSNNDYTFQVSPIARGLVGLVYKNKAMTYDDKISERKIEYNLNHSHLNDNVIANTDFVLAKPFVDKLGNVKYIITFDTEQNIEIPKDENERKKIEKTMIYYSDLFGNLLNNLN